MITKTRDDERETGGLCFLGGALSRLGEAADKYFIQGISKSFHSLEDIASISFQKKKRGKKGEKKRKKERESEAFPGSDLLKNRNGEQVT